MSDAPLSAPFHSDRFDAATFYKVGGALPQDVPSYVTRASDEALYAALKAGEFCYVLNSRQMGKSSLMVRTLTRLQADGWAGVILDFSAKDSQSDQPNRWYAGIINQLNRDLQLLDRPALRQWLQARDFIAPVERLGEFIETVLLPGSDRVVILIDEIDSTITLPFTDDFFALIRACYNKRAENPAYQRLTLALFGVALPSELIGDVKRTPFNIGQAIDLKGFDADEALPLATGLAAHADRPPVALQEILHWTGGQPFLTQWVCQLVVDAAVPLAAGSEAKQVAALVRSRVIEQWESQDHQAHLNTIRQRLLDNEQKAGYWLELYRQIRQAGSLPAQNRPEERELQLAGLVVKREGQLQVYNPIYTAVFDDAWIDAELKKLRPYAESFRAWIASDKTDRSRLLRGDALTEAEHWATERTPSAEDREFLSASRIQQQEAAIAAKEREAELAREKAAREAAEAAEQIQVEANRQAQRKIRRGSLVLGGALVAALVLGGLAVVSGNQFRVARQQRDEAQALAQEARDDLSEIEGQKEQAEQQLSQAAQQVQTTREERDQANEELAQSQDSLRSLESQRQAADERLKQAQQKTQEQQASLEQLEQNLADADAAVADAKQAEKEAQQKAAQAEEDLIVAQQALAEVAQEQKEIAALNDTTTTLSGLIDDLYAIEKPEAAEDVIQHIGLAFTDFTDDRPELKQALLNSSIALAHLHRIPFPSEDNNAAQARIEEAQKSIEKSVQLIEANPNLFNSSGSESERAIAFFTYAVEGNLQEEQAYLQAVPAPTSGHSSYENAFHYTSATPNFNSEAVTSSFRQLLETSADESEGEQFRALVTAALKKHYDLQAKQWMRELETALDQHQWNKADELTLAAFQALAYSQDLMKSYIYDLSYVNTICPSFQEIETLWEKHSEGHFGFRVQRDRYLETGNAQEEYSGESWVQFNHQVGWIRIHGNSEAINSLHDERIERFGIDLPYRIDGIEGNELTLHIPSGYFPTAGNWQGDSARNWGYDGGSVYVPCSWCVENMIALTEKCHL